MLYIHYMHIKLYSLKVVYHHFPLHYHGLSYISDVNLYLTLQFHRDLLNKKHSVLSPRGWHRRTNPTPGLNFANPMMGLYKQSHDASMGLDLHLPTFPIKNHLNVGKYTIHRSYTIRSVLFGSNGCLLGIFVVACN